MLGDINPNLPIPAPDVFLSKPDGTILGKIESHSGLGFSRFGKRKKLISHNQLFKLNNINEMDFSIPFQMEINHELVRNPIVDLVRNGYYLKVLLNGNEEWYIVTSITKSADDQKDIMTIKSRSLGYELIYRQIRNWNVVGINLSAALNGGNTVDTNGNPITFQGILAGTLWTLDPSYDATFDTIYRSINLSQVTVLDALIQIAKTFNAIIIWDTVNRRINFQQLKNVGHDKGFKISYKNYMKSLQNEANGDELVTRFRPIGKAGLTISSVTSNGLDYIDDFSNFLYPFSRDINKNVITSSYYFSDSLSNALLDYQALLTAHKGDFTTLLNNLTGYQSQLIQKKNDMVLLKTQLITIQNQIDIKQTTGQDASSLLGQQASQQALINTKQSEIDTVNANITSTNNSIASLRTTLSTTNNFTVSQINELSKYVRQRDWVDDKITDPQNLYDQAIVEFQKYNEPALIVKVDLTNFMEVVDEQRNWDKLTPVSLGDIVHIEYDTIGTNISAKIVEISFDHQNSNVTLTIANVDDLARNEEKVYKMLYQGVSASSSLSVNTERWNGIDNATQNINAIYANGIDAAKLAINGGASNTIVINNRGLTSTTSTDPNSIIRINNGVLGFSGDGGNSFAVAIDKTGVYANRLVGQIASVVTLSANQITTGSLSGINMSIGSGNQVFKANSSGISLGNATWSSAPFRVDMNGNAWATSMTLSTPSISTPSISNGTITGTSINVANNFIVDSSGNVTANNGTFRGTIQATSGSFAGSISSTATISGGSVIGATIKTANSGTRVELSSNFADVHLYSGANHLFQIYDGVSQVRLSSPSNISIIIGDTSNSISAQGSWSFGSASVSGLTTSAVAGLESRLQYLEDHAFILSYRSGGSIFFNSKNVSGVDSFVDAS